MSFGVACACDQLNLTSTQTGRSTPSMVSSTSRVSVSTSALVEPPEPRPAEKGTRWISFASRPASCMPAMIVSSTQSSRACGVMPPIPSPRLSPSPVRFGYSLITCVTTSRV